MLDHRPMTPAEEAADLAWEEYAATARIARQVFSDPASSDTRRRVISEEAVRAHRRFERAFKGVLEPTPPSAEAGLVFNLALEFWSLKRAEEVISNDEDALERACDITDAAYARLMEAETNGPRGLAEKLEATVAQYDLYASGLGRETGANLFLDIARALRGPPGA